MRGEVVSVDAVSGDGVILGPDGRRLAVRSASCLGPVEVGQAVDYVELTDDRAGEVSPADAAFRFAKRRPPRAPGAMDWGSLFATSDGRLRRSHYWIGMLILFGVHRLLGPVPLLGGVIAFAAFVLCMALQARRLRDFGQSAWWLLIPLAVWIAGWVSTMSAVSALSPTNVAGLAGLGLASIFALAFIVVIGLIPGQRGRNRYGPDTRPAPPEDAAETFA